MPAIGPRSEWLPRHYMSHFLTNKSIFYRGDPMANRKNSHRRRVRVAVDVDEAGGDGLAGRVPHLRGICAPQVAHGGDGPAGEGRVGSHGRRAGAIQDAGILNQNIKHQSTSKRLVQCSTLPEALQGAQL